ncbi:NAD(P)-dependent dehydrogenase (short-subunit alcohol dehydrogenase family) [Streptomyces sp. Ag109_O5-1]|uniref:glucose 1-dehydrogenase n=1 Tax=Streptomyces TaxID=1883 RepID=UPI000F4DE360|nr:MULTISPECIES: glucose 1-dehydrogenase [Streptomyces]RPE43847.1 NAD(P)-dependent dehydrogenase (short-subunit alcohol dehydrogenase family) [Streptomyces sp. Ag109_O5-1]
MTARFKDKVVVVTGAGAGIGRASARAFAREGAAVVAAGARPDSIEETVRLVGEDGGTASAVVADVTRPEDMQRLVRTTVERHGGLHVAHNNAGVFGRPAPVGDLDLAAWQAVLDVNLTGVLLSMQQEIVHMRAHGGGVIVNTASNIGYHGRRPGMAAYAASKAAVSTLTRVAALDHIKDNVRINAVSPGATDTGMSLRPGETDADRAARLATTVPIGRVATTEEIVNAVLWLASDESSFVVGHDLVVDGGVTS